MRGVNLAKRPRRSPLASTSLLASAAPEDSGEAFVLVGVTGFEPVAPAV
jgi:hypothetical protein